ncbi:MAG TPA: TraM recognition domain-containing protein [Gammaproteobacteria bacterium]|nr:TraM recognition domain-containing protein [Gammaproteobacteria bacterium]
MRGLERSQEQKTSQIIRDTRPLGKRVADFLHKPFNVSAVVMTISLGAAFVPALCEVAIVVCLGITLYSFSHKETLPFKMPKRARVKDYNDINAGTKKPNTSSGIYFFGNDKKTNQELWFSDGDMRTHVLIFGSTGSGKTVAMISIAFNALVQASGFIYVDGKGDNSLYASVFSMMKYMGREDDLLLINFMTGARDIIGPQEKRLSNTLNPFATGSSSMLANLVTGMMDSGGGSGDGDMWKGRAIAFVEALLKVLVAMRDAGHILLDANSIRNYFALDRIEAMVEDRTFIRDGQYAISMENLPPVVIEPIKNYLASLPGYNKERKGKQVSQVFEQHGYITMQLTRVFTSLADTYGHILRTKLAEVDMKDVVLNRRVLVVLLPALEKSPDELSNLGKIVIATMRSMMAAGLGDAVEGSYQDLILRKPTNSPTPYLCILDEYGYYAVKGFAVVPAQARSLGFSVIFAGQDLPAFQKASKEEAASIGANTNIKICMKLEDPTETWEFFMKGAGEAYVTTVDSFSANSGNLTNTYMDSRSAKTDKRSRIDLLDLKEQGLGQAHIFFKSQIVRANMFYANPEPAKAMRLNQLLKVDLPEDQKLYNLVKGIEDFEDLSKTYLPEMQADQDSIITSLGDYYAGHERENLVEFAVNYLVSDTTETVIDASGGEVGEIESFLEESANIFTRVNINEKMANVIQISKDEAESELVSKGDLTQSLSYIFRYFDMPESEAKIKTETLVADIMISTSYMTPEDEGSVSSDVVIGACEALINYVEEGKEET